MSTIFFALGSNIPPRVTFLSKALELMDQRIGKRVALSSFIKTQPMDFASEQSFLNGVVKYLTNRSPMEILETTQEIEKELGRKIKSINKIYHDRTIDIDLLFYDDLICNMEEGRLILPHPHIFEREFVLQPLKEILTKEELLHYKELFITSAR